MDFLEVMQIATATRFHPVTGSGWPDRGKCYEMGKAAKTCLGSPQVAGTAHERAGLGTGNDLKVLL